MDVRLEPAADASHLLAVSTQEQAEIADIIGVAARWFVIADVAIHEASLDEAFLSLTGRDLRD